LKIFFIYSKGLSSSLQRSSIPSVSRVKALFGQDSSEHSSITSGLNHIPSTNDDICDYDTIDALPHIDHYRNLFSITTPESKTRPTLEVLHGTASVPSRLKLASTIDLHGEMVSTLIVQTDQPSQIDMEPKTEIVKFGWIIGVLVCFSC
jgi:hypothetical protein